MYVSCPSIRVMRLWEVGVAYVPLDLAVRLPWLQGGGFLPDTSSYVTARWRMCVWRWPVPFPADPNSNATRGKSLTYIWPEVNSAFYPPWDGKMSTCRMAELYTNWRRVKVWPTAAYRLTQRISLQLRIRVCGHLVLTIIYSSDPSELWQLLCHDYSTLKNIIW